MYIWVILAVFMATLAGFNLHYRTDVREVTQAPMAEAIVSKIIIQHRALQSFIKYKKNDFNSYTNSSYPINSSDLSDFIPNVFKMDANTSSNVYCIKDDENLNTLKSCADDGIKVYAITIMQIPGKWMNYQYKEPNSEIRTAINTLMGFNSSFGYVKKVTDISSIDASLYPSEYEINNNSDIRNFIPEAIYSDSTFSNLCTSTSTCLIHMTIEYSKEDTSGGTI